MNFYLRNTSSIKYILLSKKNVRKWVSVKEIFEFETRQTFRVLALLIVGEARSVVVVVWGTVVTGGAKVVSALKIVNQSISSYFQNIEQVVEKLSKSLQIKSFGGNEQ